MMFDPFHPRAPRSEPLRCDFCHAAGPPLTPYPCRPFTLLFILRGDTLLIREYPGAHHPIQPDAAAGRTYAFTSLDGWAACPVCAELIDAGALGALEQRMLTCLNVDSSMPAERAVQTQHVQAILHGFWRHRTSLN